jgi:hypothetical protein
MHKLNQLDHSETEEQIISGIKHYWEVGITDVGEPYHGGYCLVDPDGRLLAWLRIFSRKHLTNGLKFDVRRLMEVTPFVSASGRPLVIIVQVSGRLTYVVWKPGVAEFYSYVPTRDNGQIEYDVYWDAVIPGTKMKPMGHSLPRELTGRTGSRQATKYPRWRGVLEPPITT